MNKEITVIDSSKITETIANLCKQANIYARKDLYTSILNAYKKESCKNAKNIFWQILENIRLSYNLERPICQDTGIVVSFVEIGQDVIIQGDTLENAINEGIQTAYKDNFFRKSIIQDPIFERNNTGTNTPSIIHTQIVPGNSIKILLAAKGCGSENMSSVKMLNPSAGPEGIIEFAVETVKNAGANPCPPVKIGIGVGGSIEYAAFLSKKALSEPIRSEDELSALSKTDKIANLELEILRRINDLRIGAAGLGGDTTILGVNILSFPTHIAGLPVAVNINCHASRYAKAEIFENKIEYKLEDFQHEFEQLSALEENGKRINTDDISAIKALKAGDEVLLSGYIYTARDAAHKKMMECIDSGAELPIEIKDKLIYYVGPCPAKENEIIGPAGPTTSDRMDKYTPALMSRGLLGSIGKGSRSEEVINSIKENKGIYFIATGGAANLLSQRISKADIVAYPELGPEAIYKLKIENFPVIVAVDKDGSDILI